MKIISIIISLLFLVLLLTQIYSFSRRTADVQTREQQLSAEMDKEKTDQGKLQSDLLYYQDPANLEKELRQRFNYRAPDEKLIIIVPPQASGTATTTP